MMVKWRAANSSKLYGGRLVPCSLEESLVLQSTNKKKESSFTTNRLPREAIVVTVICCRCHEDLFFVWLNFPVDILLSLLHKALPVSNNCALTNDSHDKQLKKKKK